MTFTYPLTGLVTLVSVAIYFWMSIRVGGARGKFNVPAPQTNGPDDFMRVNRVHQNTLEGLAMFLPVLWLFALTTHDAWAAVIGIFYPIGRLIYAQGYYKAAEKRGPGFIVGALTTLVLFLGSLAILLWNIYQTCFAAAA